MPLFTFIGEKITEYSAIIGPGIWSAVKKIMTVIREHPRLPP